MKTKQNKKERSTYRKHIMINDNNDNSLLTPKAFELSLSAPRVPPHGTAHRALLNGEDPTAKPWVVVADNHHPATAAAAAASVKCHTQSVSHPNYMRDFFHRQYQQQQEEKQQQQQQQQLDNENNNTKENNDDDNNHEIYYCYHPHLSTEPNSGDRWKRRLSELLGNSFWNNCRDSGKFRSFMHSQVYIGVPMLALSNPSLAYQYLQLTYPQNDACFVHIPYGDHHPSQFIHLFFPHDDNNADKNNENDDNNNKKKNLEDDQNNYRGLIFFVHGGAWGSGMPWMYRLVALPFLIQNFVVAVVGYRTYPDSPTCNDQVDDLELAATELAKRYPNLCSSSRRETPPSSIQTTTTTSTYMNPINSNSSNNNNNNNNNKTVCVIGHSSGAHIVWLMIVNRAIQQMKEQQQQSNMTNSRIKATTTTTTQPQKKNATTTKTTMRIDLVIGISGPYDINHHFDYEAERGVEELSPMKAACGLSREEFRNNSPMRRLFDSVATICDTNNTTGGSSVSCCLQQYVPAHITFIHGIEDETVPFTSTAEAVGVLRSLGITNCKEIYVPQTGHEEAIVQVMMGGKTQTAVMDSLLLQEQQEQEQSKQEEKPQVLFIPSKL